MNEAHFNVVQSASVKLMTADLKYLYTILVNKNQIRSNYIPSILPYMGVMIDGIEDWVHAYNRSNKVQLPLPVFTKEEQTYYEMMRSTIKLWQQSYQVIYDLLKRSYERSDEYFSSLCKPIAQKLNLYDIFGVDLVNGIYCGNTILCSVNYPNYNFSVDDGERTKKMAEIGGAYIALFGATAAMSVDTRMVFSTRDFGGFIKSPMGNTFSNKFLLFSILCQINFIIFCLELYIQGETPTKLRFSYLLYYSLVSLVSEINDAIGSRFVIDPTWRSDTFRNAMAHYKLGVALKENELDFTDPMFGLTQKYFHLSFSELHVKIINQLAELATQIECFLGLHNYWNKETHRMV